MSLLYAPVQNVVPTKDFGEQYMLPSEGVDDLACSAAMYSPTSSRENSSPESSSSRRRIFNLSALRHCTRYVPMYRLTGHKSSYRSSSGCSSHTSREDQPSSARCKSSHTFLQNSLHFLGSCCAMPTLKSRRSVSLASRLIVAYQT